MKRTKIHGKSSRAHTENRAVLIEAALKEATSYLADDFSKDRAIDGASMVEWFSAWREKAKRILSEID